MKKYLFLPFLVLLGLFLAGCTSSEEEGDKVGSIYGIVTELGSSQPIEGSGVELYKDGSLLLRTTTYADGHYEFSDLTPGHYTLKTVNAGYEETTYDVTVQAGRQSRADMQISKIVVNTYMVVRTMDVEELTGNGCTFKGEYTYQGYNSANEVGFVYSNNPLPSSGGTIIKSKAGSKANGAYPFTEKVSGLSAGTYYVQAYAINDVGTTYGEVRQFVISGAPVIVTESVTDITETTAVLNARIDNVGDPAYTECGFVYSSSLANPSVGDPISETVKIAVKGSASKISANIGTLKANTTYYVRAYVENSKGVFYGDVVAFTTEEVKQYVVIGNLAIQKQDLAYTTQGGAADLCKASRVNGFDDWRLPTRAELAFMYAHRKEIEGIQSVRYWSDEYERVNIGSYSTYAFYHYYYDFVTGQEGHLETRRSSSYPDLTKTGNCYVRAVRTVK